MKLNINFLKDYVLKTRKKAQKHFFIRTWSLLALVIYGVLVVAVFSLHLLAKKTNEVVKTGIKKEESLIEELRSIEMKQVYLTAKTKSLDEVLSGKKQHQQIVETLLALLPRGVSISDLKIDPDGAVSFSASCTSFRSLVDFFNILKTNETELRLKIKKADISGVSYGLEKNYSFDVILFFYLS
ncbi:MAG TPA: hypothetical protein VMW29_03930 [Candidatus Bathyarchaeia archaeon]|nr:hypothetical protein [Candidatus Bathyarchaeia archaeon]